MADPTANLVKAQLDKALNVLTDTPVPAPAPAPVTRTEPAGTQAVAAAPAAPAGAPTPSSPELAELLKFNKELQTQLAEMRKAMAAAAGVKAEPAQARPTVKGVEGQVEDVRADITALRAEVETANELARIERELPATAEYATLKGIPDLAQRVLAAAKAQRQAALEAGEGSVEVSVAAITKSLKESLVAQLKSYVSNAELAKEIGLVPSSIAATPSSQASRALTGDIGAQASKQTTVAKSSTDLLAKQLSKAMQVLRS